MSQSGKILVTDFDGTVTRRDFYACVVEQLLTPEDLGPWHEYMDGRSTHFEALRRIFAKIRASEAALDRMLESMDFDRGFECALNRLTAGGWEVVIVSNGSLWYIQKLLAAVTAEYTLHSNPGTFDSATGLRLELPETSPFFCPETGISKRAVVEDAIKRGKDVAFAGDGRPDLAPALLVPPARRFAREWLADELTRLEEGYRRFDRWSEIADHLLWRAS